MSSPPTDDATAERDARLAKFYDSAPIASWVFGGLILIFLMVVVFVDVNRASRAVHGPGGGGKGRPALSA